MVRLISATILTVGLNGEGKALEKLPLRVIRRDMGREALAWLRGHRDTRALVSRWSLPDMAGGELIRRVKRVRPWLPTVVMLDEPSQGLAPLLVTMMFKVISELKQSGISILLVEQNAAASLAISDRGYVLEMGRVVLSGPANALIENQEIKSAYLGSVKK